MIEIIIGAVMVVTIGLISEIRIQKHRKNIELLNAKIEHMKIEMDSKDKIISSKNKYLKDLALKSKELVGDYAIIVEIAEDEIGEDRLEELYISKKSNIKDLNEFIKKYKGRKKYE